MKRSSSNDKVKVLVDEHGINYGLRDRNQNILYTCMQLSKNTVNKNDTSSLHLDSEAAKSKQYE